jgi:hypothetical protein
MRESRGWKTPRLHEVGETKSFDYSLFTKARSSMHMYYYIICTKGSPGALIRMTRSSVYTVSFQRYNNTLLRLRLRLCLCVSSGRVMNNFRLAT